MIFGKDSISKRSGAAKSFPRRRVEQDLLMRHGEALPGLLRPDQQFGNPCENFAGPASLSQIKRCTKPDIEN